MSKAVPVSTMMISYSSLKFDMLKYSMFDSSSGLLLQLPGESTVIFETALKATKGAV